MADKVLIIAEDSCDGDESQFEKWMNENYPEIQTRIENVLHGVYYIDGEATSCDFWNEYCRS